MATTTHLISETTSGHDFCTSSSLVVVYLLPPGYLSQDNLVLDTPRQRRQVRRYGNEHMEEIVDLGDDMMDMFPLRTSRRGWSKVECLKVEKGLLTYG